MPKRIIPLSEAKVRTAKPQDKDYKLFDGGGLFLLVTSSGGKLWHFKYRFDGKEKKMSMGTYPEISLGEARARREEARKQLAHDIDPGAVRKAMREAATAETETFEVIAREWHTKFTPTWTAGHAGTLMARLERKLLGTLFPSTTNILTCPSRPARIPYAPPSTPRHTRRPPSHYGKERP